MLIVLCCVVIYASEVKHDMKVVGSRTGIYSLCLSTLRSHYDFIVESQYDRIAVRS